MNEREQEIGKEEGGRTEEEEEEEEKKSFIITIMRNFLIYSSNLYVVSFCYIYQTRFSIPCFLFQLS